MKCRDSIMNSKLFCQLIFVIVSQLIKPSPFTSFAFNDNCWIKENIQLLVSVRQMHLILTSIRTNLWNHSSLHSAHLFLLMRILMEKGAKIIKELRNIFIVKCYFSFYVLVAFGCHTIQSPFFLSIYVIL